MILRVTSLTQVALDTFSHILFIFELFLCVDVELSLKDVWRFDVSKGLNARTLGLVVNQTERVVRTTMISFSPLLENSSLSIIRSSNDSGNVVTALINAIVAVLASHTPSSSFPNPLSLSLSA